MAIRNIITLSFVLFISGSASLFGQTDSTKTEQRLSYQLGFGLTTFERANASNSYNALFYGNITYFLNPLFQPGLATGYDEYNEFSGIPVMLIFQGEIGNRKHLPIYYVQGGLTHFFEEDNERFDSIVEGRIFEAGLGYAFGFKETRLTLTIGWRRQMLTTEGWEGYGYFYTTDIFASSFLPPTYQTTHWKLDRMVFRIGLAF